VCVGIIPVMLSERLW